VKDLKTGNISIASTGDKGGKGNGSSVVPSLSADGNLVAFFSDSSNLDPADTDADPDVYVKDLVTGDLQLVSTSEDGAKANGFSSFPALSADGTIVTFHSTATNLDPADQDDFEDVYVKNLSSGDISLASISEGGTKGGGASLFPSISGDGASVAFESFAGDLDPADTDTTPDIFVKDLVSGDLSLASTSGDETLKSDRASLFPALSGDGTRVAFQTNATNLDPTDVDALTDVYVKDLETGMLSLASISEHGKGNRSSIFPAISHTGADVAFQSNSTNLDLADQDTITDVYIQRLMLNDRDRDGVADDEDNCPDIDNPDQDDSDRDAIGTACEDEIVFVGRHGGDSDIYAMNSDGSARHRLTLDEGRDEQPAWSPDRDRIAFVSDRSGNEDIYVMNSDGSDVTQLTFDDASDVDPSWSNDGDLIVFSSRRDRNYELYALDPGNPSSVTRLTRSPSRDRDPTWSPSDDVIAFTSSRGSGLDIYLLDVESGGVDKLISRKAQQMQPDWSPSGDALAYVSNHGSGFDIVVALLTEKNGSLEVESESAVAPDSSKDVSPAFSGNGRRLAFVSNRDGNFDVFTVDESGVRAITSYKGMDVDPDWEPLP
jgi:Tol biopolymer transport system component